MALHGLTLSSTKPYVSDLDPGKGKEGAEITTFTLGPVDVFVTAQLFDRRLELPRDGSSPRLNINAMNLDYVRYGLRNFENYYDGSGKLVKFETEERFVSGRSYKVVREDILSSFPIELIQELGQEVQTLSTVDQDEAKNS